MIKKNVNKHSADKLQLLYSKIIYIVLICFIFNILNLLHYNNYYLDVKFPLANLTRNMTFTKKKPNEKIIVMIFAGRKDFIEIGMKYLLFLLGKGKIDEIHFWLFIGDTYNFRYMNSISNLHKTSKYFNEYLEIYPKIIGNKVDLSIKGEGNAFILINDKIEIVIDAESEELKQNLTSQFKGEKLIFIDDIIDKNNYTIISLKFVKNNLIIQNKKKLLKSISTNEI